jgi:16S rRNA (cytosine967-C5)-methyltransferase
LFDSKNGWGITYTNEMTAIFPYIFYQNCATLLFEYDGGTPFHLYLKSCFKENKNWGSTDRKRYRSACYYFWRNAFGVSRQSPEIILHWLQIHLTPEMENLESDSKYNPYQSLEEYLSQNITTDILTPWFIKEPLVWLSNGNITLKGLQGQLIKAGITIEQTHGNAIAVSGQVNLNPWVDNGNAYIQDISSQTAMDWTTQPMAAYCHANSDVWDCCSGAGGKSISLLKQYPTTKLTCSDVRSNILENLKQRFQLLGLKQPNVFIAPLNGYNDNLNSKDSNQTYNLILADVPCSGSGTWRRNPENLHYFDPQTIEQFADRQLNIIQNVLPSLAVGGYLVYLTCSIFAAENENNIKQILQSNKNLQLVSEEFCGGIDLQGDFIYRSVLQKVN